jgi:NADPH:quinone reductase-like Zn-dependent oxidoreductase
MIAAYAASTDPDEPLGALTVGEVPDPVPLDGDWAVVDVRAASLNHHDLWSLRGVGLPPDRLPMVLGCDAAGIDDRGADVVVYPVLADPADPRGWSLLSERFQGTLAEKVVVPRANLVPKPEAVSWVHAACLPTAWLTAYHMLRAKGRVDEASAVLVQGAGGGVATAAIVLAVAWGKRVYATSRDAGKRERAAILGAVAVEAGARLPERVDLVIETVGAATMEHSLKCAAPGARIVVSGSTSGHLATVDLRRVFAMRLELLGSSMGTAAELAELVTLCANGTVSPIVDSVHPVEASRAAFERLASGEVFGKVVVDFGTRG